MLQGLTRIAVLTTVCLSGWHAWARQADRPPSADMDLAGGVSQLAVGTPVASSLGFPATMLAPSFVDLGGVASEVLETKTAAGVKAADGQVAAALSPAPHPIKAIEPTARRIHTNYEEAMREATESRKMLFIYFHEPRMTAARRAFETRTLPALEIQEKLKRYVYLEVPTTVEITSGGKSSRLLSNPAFAEMLGRPGVAIIDLCHVRAEYYGRVVSTFPFTPGKFYRKEALSIILDLPPGTLTQRTMIYAVRIHPEAPQSTKGQFHLALAEEAKSHANHQASIQVQGHHSWDSRFHRINAKLPGDVLAQEVVAESWPNETLVEACLECVNSWRQSPGHWNAVRARHPLFGYDIKRGRNGIWYATGIFGRRN